MKQIPLSLGIAALLAGCQTSSDPADGGFFNGVAGVSSGTYQGRVDALEGQPTSSVHAILMPTGSSVCP